MERKEIELIRLLTGRECKKSRKRKSTVEIKEITIKENTKINTIEEIKDLIIDILVEEIENTKVEVKIKIVNMIDMINDMIDDMVINMINMIDVMVINMIADMVINMIDDIIGIIKVEKIQVEVETAIEEEKKETEVKARIDKTDTNVEKTNKKKRLLDTTKITKSLEKINMKSIPKRNNKGDQKVPRNKKGKEEVKNMKKVHLKRKARGYYLRLQDQELHHRFQDPSRDQVQIDVKIELIFYNYKFSFNFK